MPGEKTGLIDVCDWPKIRLERASVPARLTPNRGYGGRSVSTFEFAFAFTTRMKQAKWLSSQS